MRAIPGSLVVLAAAMLVGGCAGRSASLDSWSDGAAREAITAFVERVTTPGPDFVEPADRIAVFDNDGTLWTEQPMYSQVLFALDRLRELAPEHPEWRTQEPYRSALAGDMHALAAQGKEGIGAIIMATHAGTTTEEFSAIVERWIADARHPTLDRPYTEAVYQPMVDLLEYLRDRGFATYIVSGGGVEFVRPWADDAYGITPDRVIGSVITTTYEVRGGTPVLVRHPEPEFIDDGPGKPVAINRVIGRRPLMAFGNSDGDFEMLEWTTSGPGPHFAALVHHDDAEREVAYDRESHIGRLDRGLDAAPGRGWLVISMRDDWTRVFPESGASVGGSPGIRRGQGR